MAKKYTPNEKEKYMSEKQKTYFKKRLVDWKNEIIELNSKGLYLNDVDHEISSPDVVDQAASQTEKTVEMRTLNRQIKLLSKIALRLVHSILLIILLLQGLMQEANLLFLKALPFLFYFHKLFVLHRVAQWF